MEQRRGGHCQHGSTTREKDGGFFFKASKENDRGGRTLLIGKDALS
jgi:hypothetical protein